MLSQNPADRTQKGFQGRGWAGSRREVQPVHLLVGALTAAGRQERDIPKAELSVGRPVAPAAICRLLWTVPSRFACFLDRRCIQGASQAEVRLCAYPWWAAAYKRSVTHLKDVTCQGWLPVQLPDWSWLTSRPPAWREDTGMAACTHGCGQTQRSSGPRPTPAAVCHADPCWHLLDNQSNFTRDKQRDKRAMQRTQNKRFQVSLRKTERKQGT